MLDFEKILFTSFEQTFSTLRSLIISQLRYRPTKCSLPPDNLKSIDLYVLQHNIWRSQDYVLTLPSNSKKHSMTTTLRLKLNRINAVSAETSHPGKWLAEQLGKKPVTVSKWYTNTSLPDLYTLQEIAQALGANIKDLIHS